ncbi:MAG TPA: filamentous hemagglutinin N-terminal domain-containing protein [Stenomitos sp.]
MNRFWNGGLLTKGLQWATGAFGLVPIGLAVFSVPVLAQIVPDNTLGTESSLVTPNVNIRGLPAERIDGGAVRGSALFHSFSEFNVNNGQRVYFSNPAGIADIFSRVTGLNISNILGTLGVDGGANLFLLNPNGILFGPNAQLDIQGSFLATTGSSFKFSDGSEFSATQPQAAPLLSINVPLGLQWGTQPLGKINNAGNLQVGSGQTLALHGSDVTSTGSLNAPGGTVMMLGDRIGLLDNARINVSSATGGGTVLIGGGLQGKDAVPNAARTFVDAGVRIEADALTTGNGGNVIVWADEVTGFYGNISARGGTEAGNGGFVEVSGKQNLIFRGAVNTSASQGNSGTLLLDPDNITIVNGDGATDDNQIKNDGQIWQGDGGASPFTISEKVLQDLLGDTNVILQATNDITINDLTDNALTFKRGTGKITFTADADGNGVGSFLMQDVKDTLYTNGRNIEISGASLTLGNINTFSISEKTTSTQEVVVDVDAGGLIPPTETSGTATFNFTVPNNLVRDGNSYDLSTSTISDLNVRFSAEHTWDADLDVSLKSPRGTLLNLFSDVGSGGNNFQDTLLDDEASTSINDGTAPFIGSFKPVAKLEKFDNENPLGNWTLTVTDDAGGDSGRLFKGGEIAPWGTAIGTQLVLQLKINTNQPVIIPVDGNSGSITLNATNGNISADSLNTNNKFLRDGGAINLKAAGEITINNLNSSSNNLNSSSSGNGGAIALTAQNNIQAGSLDASTGSGSGGNITITSLNGEIKTINNVSTATTLVNAYNGGDITFRAKGNITIDRYTRSDGGNKGESGEINITSETGNVTVNNTINSLNFGQKGGDLNIEALAGSIFLNDNAYLTSGNTSNATGNGGNINIKTGSLSVTNSKINTSTSGQGNAGNVIIDARDRVFFDGTNSGLNTTTSGIGNVGKGGDIKITTGSLSVTNSAQLNASTKGSGSGGNLSITANNSVTLSNDGKLLAEASGTGRAGNVSITAEGQVALTRGQISTNIQAGANVPSGQPSVITIDAGNLSVTEGGKISASVNAASVNASDPTKNVPAGQGDAGKINLIVRRDTILSGENSRISNAIQAEASGQAGSITLNTGTLTAMGGASIDSSLAGTGTTVGQIRVDATGAIAF